MIAFWLQFMKLVPTVMPANKIAIVNKLMLHSRMFYTMLYESTILYERSIADPTTTPPI